MFGWQQSSPSGVDLEFAGMMRFADGSVAQFDSGFNGPFRAEMEVVGRDAALRIRRPFRTDGMSRLLLTTGDDTETLPFDPEPPFAGEIADMESAALDGRPPRIPLSESRRTVQTICALYESARTGTVPHRSVQTSGDAQVGGSEGERAARHRGAQENLRELPHAHLASAILAGLVQPGPHAWP